MNFPFVSHSPHGADWPANEKLFTLLSDCEYLDRWVVKNSREKTENKQITRIITRPLSLYFCCKIRFLFFTSK